MNASTVHRLLGLLEEEGLVHQDERGGRYGIGAELVRLAWSAVGSHPVGTVALPFLRELATASGETATLGVYDPVRRQTCVVAVVESDAPFRFTAPLYEWRDLHAGASGRAVLAFLPEEERLLVAERTQLAAATEHTITSLEELEHVLARVRELGYAFSTEERRLGGVGIAAPVFGPGGSVVGEVGLSIPLQRFSTPDEQRLAVQVVRCAALVTDALGGGVAHVSPP
jgi:DNA-binding IclR family transcriptional regulator